MLNIWLLLIISRWIMLWNKAVFCLEVLIYKRLQMWRRNDVIGRNEYLILHYQNLPFLRYIHCNFCLNLHITHGDMLENASGCFFCEHSVERTDGQTDRSLSTANIALMHRVKWYYSRPNWCVMRFLDKMTAWQPTVAKHFIKKNFHISASSALYQL